MHTIVLATQKGGSGKSTLAIGLALAAIQAGHTVRSELPAAPDIVPTMFPQTPAEIVAFVS